MNIKISLLIICLLPILGCKDQSIDGGVKKDAKLGEVELKVNGAEEAQIHFKNGLLLLHSFEYLDARAEFLKAQAIDKNFGMAYWGELMAYNHPIWKRQLTDRAHAVFTKMGSTVEKRRQMFKSEIELDFFKAMEILYGEGTKVERDIAYRDYMAKLNKKYPDNHEVSAFYAVSLLGSSQNGREDALFDKSAQIAQGILKENNQHPGALHYLIHSYDDPDHAHMAVKAADSYALVAPDAAHALHMPSHIYVALGRWKDVVNSNIASWNASMKKRKAGKTAEGSYHALNWLQYGLLQRGEFDKASELVDLMEKHTEETKSKSAVSYLLAMKGAQNVETDTWHYDLDELEERISNMGLVKRSQLSFVKGMQAFENKDVSSLKSVLNTFNKDIYKSSLDVGNQSYQMCSSGEYASVTASQLDLDMAKIMAKELEAALLSLKGEQDKAIALLKEATELDETLKYAFGPPFILKPVAEMYADFLKDSDQYQLAYETYDRSLKRHPRRLHSLKGKLDMAQKIKADPTEIAQIEKEINISQSAQQWDEIL